MRFGRRAAREITPQPRQKNTVDNFRDVSHAGPVQGGAPIWSNPESLERAIKSAVKPAELRPKSS